MKLGIIGTGLIVTEFLPYLKEMGGLELCAILSTPRSIDTAKTLASDYSIPLATSDFEDFIHSDIDTAYVAVPNFMHFSYCEKVLSAKKNVIVEKPMTSNDSEAQALKEIAEKNGCFLFEAITTLHLGSFRKIQEWLGKIGTVKLVQSQCSQYSRRYDAFRAGEVLPAFDPAKAGGALMDLNLYNLHLVMGLFGKPQDCVYYANVERGIDTSGIAVLDYGSFKAFCVAAKDSRGPRGSVIQGTDGVIRTADAPGIIGKVTLELNDGTVEEFDDGMARQRMIPEFEDFIRAVNENDKEYAAKMLAASLAVTEVQTRLRKSAGVLFPMDD